MDVLRRFQIVQWIDEGDVNFSPLTSPKINAFNLNRLESGIATVVEALNTLIEEVQDVNPESERMLTLESNTIDFTLGKYLELSANTEDITAEAIPDYPKEGILVIHNSENITGWGSEFKFKEVPTDLNGDELLAYFIQNNSTIWIGRLQ